MKKLLLPSLAAIIFLVSCSSTNYPTDQNDPYPKGKSYPQQSPYPYPNDDGVMVDRQGRVITRDGRVVGNTRNLPPGQAKKIYGGRSAKAYASGQRKKVDRNYQSNSYPNKVYKEKKGNKGKG